MYDSHFFDAARLTAYVRGLPEVAWSDEVRGPTRVAIMTHDDHFDEEIYAWEQARGYRATWFLLSDEIGRVAPDADVQLHYRMDRSCWLADQIDEFAQRVGRLPVANRTHRLFRRGGYLDLANLAMHGIRVDSTVQDGVPRRLCVQSRRLPIWELPFQVVDWPFVDASQRLYPTYNARPMEWWFAHGESPVVGLFHPYLKERVPWQDFYSCAARYGYQMMTVTEWEASCTMPA